MAERPMLNHQELVIRPGEWDHAKALFELMGFTAIDMFDDQHIAVWVDPEVGPSAENVMYANEPTPAQTRLEAALENAIANDAELASALEGFRSRRREWPQYHAHFGASIPTLDEWRERVERLQEANRSHALLKGRVDVKVCEPGMPNALGPLYQAFIYTDIVSPSVLAIAGVLFDMQWIPELDLDNLDPIDFPDMATMV